MLQIEQGGPTEHKDKCPSEADAELEFLSGELGDTQSEQGNGSKVGGRPEEKIHKPRHICPDTPDKVERNIGGVRILGVRKPRGDISRLKGTECKQEENAAKKEQQTSHFIPRAST